ncbi:MAG: DHA2 family efflux MFS transporter permease subunit [Hyphomonadaceae bacterium]
MSIAAQAAAPAEERLPLGLVIALVAMMCGNFIALLDIQIVASAIGSIQAGVSASRDEISRVQSAYLIAEVIGIPLSGFLSRALGVRILFTGSALLFGLASMLCAISWDMTSLVVFRALQGFVGAAMIPTTFATLYGVVPRSQQASIGMVVAMLSTLAPSLGPTLGGSIAEHLGWRTLFSINLVPSLLIAGAVWRYMSAGQQPNFPLLRKIDFIGLIGLALFLGAFEYVLEEGPKNGWFEDGHVVAWSAACAAGAAMFFWRALTQETPIVDLRPFTHRTFMIGAALTFLIGVGLFTPVFLQPLFLVQVRGLNAEQIGHLMVAQGLAMAVIMALGMPTVARLADLRPVGFVGFFLVALSCWIETHLTAQSDFWELLTPQILRGSGLVLTFMSVTQTTLQAMPPQIMQASTALYNLCRNLGGAVGLAVGGTMQTHFFALHRQELYTAAKLNDPNVHALIARHEAFLSASGAPDPHRQAILGYVGLLDREALVMSFNDQFLMLTLALAVASLGVWALKPAPFGAAPVDAH